jgi:hypothetical protein
LNRPAAVLTLLIALTISGCGFGFTRAPTAVTGTTATLNGVAYSTIGGPGSWYFEYGAPTSSEKGPVHSVAFDAGEPTQMSEPVSGIDAAQGFAYRACAEDANNKGNARCDTFRAVGRPVVVLIEDCHSGFGVHAELVGLAPHTPFHLAIQFPSGETLTYDLDSGPTGTGGITLGWPEPGTWKFDVNWAGGSATSALDVDCSPS